MKTLAEPLGMSLPAVSQHLKVLERAGLISRGREAQWRPARLDASPIKAVAQWAYGFREYWQETFERLGLLGRRRLQHAHADDPEFGYRLLADEARAAGPLSG